MSKKIHVTDTILRDAHQSLLATRMRTEDMLPICDKLDKVGYWSLEVWGGATFDACVRFLKEDPWERLRQLRQFGGLWQDLRQLWRIPFRAGAFWRQFKRDIPRQHHHRDTTIQNCFTHRDTQYLR